MACWTIQIAGQSEDDRAAELDKAAAKLEEQLERGTVKVMIGTQGAAALVGWEAKDRAGMADTCAIRTLTLKGSWAMKQAIASAERLSGRKLDAAKVAQGVHSHDGGATWSHGH